VCAWQQRESEYAREPILADAEAGKRKKVKAGFSPDPQFFYFQDRQEFFAFSIFLGRSMRGGRIDFFYHIAQKAKGLRLIPVSDFFPPPPSRLRKPVRHACEAMR
jgi:hypothetical protein